MPRLETGVVPALQAGLEQVQAPTLDAGTPQESGAPAMDPQAILATLRATGAGFEGSFRIIREACPGMDLTGVSPLLAWAEEEIRARRLSGYFMEFLKRLMQIDPDFGNAAFVCCKNLVLSGNLHFKSLPFLSMLPEGLTVGEDLDLRDRIALAFLPKCLNVGGMLDLRGCTALEYLPAGLKVRRSLDLRGCTSWDGVIPKDAKIGYIFTDFFQRPVTKNEYLSKRFWKEHRRKLQESMTRFENAMKNQPFSGKRTGVEDA